MTKTKNIFYCFIIVAFSSLNADAANVVARNSRASISHATLDTSVPAIAPTDTSVTTQQETISQNTDTVVTLSNEPMPGITDKSYEFAKIFAEAAGQENSTQNDYLSSVIQNQRNALDAASNREANLKKNQQIKTSATNACDTGLRDCMGKKCGTNFMNCANDNDTIFGTKLDSCRRDLNCDANEFKLFSAEIKEDRAANIKLQSFSDIISCGQDYDNCIVQQCGLAYTNCLGKSAGDTAISKCAPIANRCKSLDNGLASRTMSVFGTLRQSAEKQVSIDEQTLYELRDQMKSACARLGAMFDERTLDCVYTVNFHGDDGTIYASKKLYAGDTFDCTPAWFGVDVTTFKENAQRLTREQSSASAAVLGAGAGWLLGSATSGGISRAIDAEKANSSNSKSNRNTSAKSNNNTGSVTDTEEGTSEGTGNQQQQPN